MVTVGDMTNADPVIHSVAFASQPYVQLRCENGCQRYVGFDSDTGTPDVYRADGALYTFVRALATCPACAAAERLIATVTP